jgi:2-polyprenyl-6-methoxyphenol hydroxylase-like FAD-dependent oxidoreductase
MLPQSTDVLIVGAGPVGLTLAARLAIEGVRFVLIDRLAAGENTSRAAVIFPRTLQGLEEIGVHEPLLAEGHRVLRFAVRDRNRLLLDVGFARLPTRYPFALMIPQNDTERILEARLHELGGMVHRHHTLVDLTQTAAACEAVVTDAGGSRRTIAARYIVGTDGMHSTVRERAAIPFRGGSYDHSFVQADVRLDWSLSDDQVMLFFSPVGLMVVAPLPHGRHRIVATMADAPEHPTPQDIQALFDARGPQDRKARVTEFIWGSRFRVHRRIAETYWAGRVLLAGDSAHVHSPAGGQGMNLGILDALDLGGLVSAVLAGRAREQVFDDYTQRRQLAAEQVIALTDRLTRIATAQGRAIRTLRNAALRVLNRIPSFGRELATNLSGLNR